MNEPAAKSFPTSAEPPADQPAAAPVAETSPAAAPESETAPPEPTVRETPVPEAADLEAAGQAVEIVAGAADGGAAAVEPPFGERATALAAEAAERRVPETGFSVAGPFRAFYEHYGPTLCGFPISDVRLEDGRRCQYFQCLALEEHAPGRVRLKPLGEAWLAMAGASASATETPAPVVVDLTARLPRHPRLHYPTRALAEIRYLVLHHTGAGAEAGPEAIAAEHVATNGWPGIGYHFVVDPAGVVYRTQDITVVSYHARQFNPAAVGIALMGDLANAGPPPAQLAAVADLAAGLLLDLGLPPDALRGHREMVPTTCPGEWFLAGWKLDLARAVAAQLVRVGAPESAVERGGRQAPPAAGERAAWTEGADTMSAEGVTTISWARATTVAPAPPPAAPPAAT